MKIWHFIVLLLWFCVYAFLTNRTASKEKPRQHDELSITLEYFGGGYTEIDCDSVKMISISEADIYRQGVKTKVFARQIRVKFKK